MIAIHLVNAHFTALMSVALFACAVFIGLLIFRIKSFFHSDLFLKSVEAKNCPHMVWLFMITVKWHPPPP